MSIRQKNRIAATDATFSYADGFWVGKCLICGGRLRFNAQTGYGATIEHIRPRSLGGSSDLLNLGLAHPQCNNEKGHHWDSRRRHRHAPEAYRTLADRLLNERQRRWRQPDAPQNHPAKRDLFLLSSYPRPDPCSPGPFGMPHAI